MGQGSTPVIAAATSASSTIIAKPQSSASSSNTAGIVQQASTNSRSTANSWMTSSNSADQTTSSTSASAFRSASPSATTETNRDSTASNQPSSLGRNVGIAVMVGVMIVLLGFAAMFYLKRKKRTPHLAPNSRDEEKLNEIVVHSKPSTGDQSIMHEEHRPQVTATSNGRQSNAYELQPSDRYSKSVRSIRSLRSVRSARSSRVLGHDRGQSEEINWPLPPNYHNGPHSGGTVTYYSGSGSGAG